MKFTVSSERKAPSAEPYSSFSIFVSIECDTATEPIAAAIDRANLEVDNAIDLRRKSLAEEYQKQVDAKKT